ncbi:MULTISPECIES: lipoprotein [Streptomyces]|uniref:lipoprotein n=1 Tax=Streptomyces TaxID=1883 RepID=UPI000AAEFB45|nr:MULTISPECIES: lipoprotein [unclassified Streptomyces]MDN5381412.1 lipoprotein [Streptomyces sp. LB8]
MGTRAGTAWRVTAAVVALLGGMLTACSGPSESADDAAPAAGASATATGEATGGATGEATGEATSGATAARSGGSVGARGSACVLPVTFDIAADWKAKAVDRPAGDSSAEEITDALLRQGPVTAACEIDAKPAGHIGFLRVWTGDPDTGDARTVLRAFVAAEGSVSKETYRPFRAGGLEGVEAEYVRTGELLDEPKQEHALAVSTPKGPVVLHLGGLDTEEHRQMLPAYELAKRTLRTT